MSYAYSCYLIMDSYFLNCLQYTYCHALHNARNEVFSCLGVLHNITPLVLDIYYGISPISDIIHISLAKRRSWKFQRTIISDDSLLALNYCRMIVLMFS